VLKGYKMRSPAIAVLVSMLCALHAQGQMIYSTSSDWPTYVRALRDQDPSIREEAAKSLASSAPFWTSQGADRDKASSEVVQALTGALKDSDAEVRRFAALALRNNQWANTPVDGIIKQSLETALKDSDAFVRINAATSLIAKGRLEPAKPALLIALKDPNVEIRLQAAQALYCSHSAVATLQPWGPNELRSPVDPMTVASISALGSLMKDRNPLVRIRTADVFRCMNLESVNAVPVLVSALGDSDLSVRRHSLGSLADIVTVNAIGDDHLKQALQEAIRQPLQVALPSLVSFLSGSDGTMQSQAVSILHQMGPDASTAVPALLSDLREKEASVRASAASVLGGLGMAANPSIPILRELELHDSDESARRSAARALKSLGVQSSPSLIAALQSSDLTIRKNAADALNAEEIHDKAAIPMLLAALSNSDAGLRRSAITAMVFPSNSLDRAYNAQELPELIAMLKSPYPEVRQFVVIALRQAGPAASAAVPSLIDSLRDPDLYLRSNVAYTLGSFGDGAKSAIPALIDCLKPTPERSNVPNDAANALSAIARGALDVQDFSVIEPLRRAEKALEAAKFTDQSKEVASAVRILRSLRTGKWYEVAFGFIEKHPLLMLPIPYLLYFAFCIYLLVYRPLMIWTIAASIESRLKQWNVSLGGIWITHVLIVGFFRFHENVLDAWVLKQLPSVKENFNRLPTVAECMDLVPGLPVKLGNRCLKEDFKPIHLKETFGRNRAYVLLHGEGGLGKTTIACQISQWVMSLDERDRPCKHVMLPVLIEGSFKPDTEEGESMLDTIRGKLGALVNLDVDPPPELVRTLLRKQRILVVVDGLSEMNEASRRSVEPDSVKFDPNALVVTSRVDKELTSIPEKTTICPLRIPSTLLPSFFKSYIDSHAANVSFEENEPLYCATELAKIAGNRPITVLLAKQYVRLMIDRKLGIESTMPENVPDIMLGYLNHLNRPSPGAPSWPVDPREVQRAAKIVAWECVRSTLHSSSATYSSVLEKLGGEITATQMIKLLNEDLRLLQIAGAGLDSVSFTLDPLAEYLAALYLVETSGSSHVLWREFLAKATGVVSSGASDGFLLALRDCLTSKGSIYSVPRVVMEEITMLLNSRIEGASDLSHKSEADKSLPAAGEPPSFGEGLVVS
jgi:HEAT repeat protein